MCRTTGLFEDYVHITHINEANNVFADCVFFICTNVVTTFNMWFDDYHVVIERVADV